MRLVKTRGHSTRSARSRRRAREIFVRTFERGARLTPLAARALSRPGAPTRRPTRPTPPFSRPVGVQQAPGQLDLERHGGKPPAGVIARLLSRILALTAAIWLNDKPASRSSDH